MIPFPPVKVPMIIQLSPTNHQPLLNPGWDNMMQTSFVLKHTIRPTFNHSFYFPVRFFNEKITSRKYLETAFLYEMKSKGDIQIQAPLLKPPG